MGLRSQAKKSVTSWFFRSSIEEMCGADTGDVFEVKERKA